MFFAQLQKFRRQPPVYPTYAAALADCRDGYQNKELVSAIAAKRVPAFSQSASTEWIAGALIAVLQASLNCARVRVLDFGGQTAAQYAVISAAFPQINLQWAIVETPSLVVAAKDQGSEHLQWFSTIDEAASWLGTIDLVLSSGTLQYVPDPKETAAALISIKADFVAWTRMSLSTVREFVTIQRSMLSSNGAGQLPDTFVDREVSYPITYLSEDQFLGMHVEHYYLALRLTTADAKVAGNRVISGASYLFRKNGTLGGQ